MSRIYEALRRAEGAPVNENEHAPDGKAARGAAKRVTLEEYPREAPVQPEPVAATPAIRQDRPALLKADRPDPVQSARLPQPPAHVPAMQTEHHEPLLRPQPVVPPPPEPSLPDFDELLVPTAPLRIDRVVTPEDEARHETTAPAPVAKPPRVTPLADEAPSSLTMPAIRHPSSPAPAMRSEQQAAAPAAPAARTDRPVPSGVPPAPAADRSAALQAVRQSRSTPAPNDRPTPRTEHPAAEGPASIWSSSVEGITSKAQRVDRSKGRWLWSLFK